MEHAHYKGENQHNHEQQLRQFINLMVKPAHLRIRFPRIHIDPRLRPSKHHNPYQLPRRQHRIRPGRIIQIQRLLLVPPRQTPNKFVDVVAGGSVADDCVGDVGVVVVEEQLVGGADGAADLPVGLPVELVGFYEDRA